MKQYNPKEIEPKWQNWWINNNTYVADLGSKKPKYMASGMFNYPSGDGIHVGHAYTFTIPDVLARFKRQQGFESLNPVGWDSFGLPAENYAIKLGISPQESIPKCIEYYQKQYTAMGWGVDWTKEIDSSQPLYYKWTQWIFSEMYKNGLVYQDSRMQWWCNQCQTVLANEQITSDGKCWRHDKADDPVIEKREVKQWFFKITEYADELLEAIDDLDWTEGVKLAQKNWIGRSVGAEIKFKVSTNQSSPRGGAEGGGGIPDITVFTTRPDTIFGATFMVLAPEHELAKELATEEYRKEVEEYTKLSARKTEVERQANKDKTGVFTGSYVINPADGEEIPVWIADYVLEGYGTGAIMCVPAHDERDMEFAKKFGLPIRQVVANVFVDDTNPHLDDKDLVERNVVTSIVKHPSEDKYLIAKPKGGANWSPIMGGIDEGEEAIATAERELIEETGYNDIASIEEVGDVFASEFFAKHKDVNRIAYCQPILIKLKSLDQDLSLAVDKDDQEVEWVTRDEYISRSSSGGMIEVLELSEGKLMGMALEGRMVNSEEFNGLTSFEAREKVVAKLKAESLAEEKVNYKMRDWSVGRQRYWGAPIPIIYCEECGPVLVPESDLPIVLPELDDFKPSGDGRSALARAKDWLKVDCPECSGVGERETDTLDTYIDSSWYLYRYLDPHNQEKIFESETADKWIPIDFYDGADHATAHLLYARFVARFFNKIGLVDNPEPIKQMLYHGKIVGSDGTNFSKSAGNGIDPLEVIESGYGADGLRTYLMFAAPAGLDIRWNPQGVPGTYRFLNRVWNIVQEFVESSETKLNSEVEAKLKSAENKMIKKVTEDIEGDRFNTAIAALMEGLNDYSKLKLEDESFGKCEAWQSALQNLVACMAPFAPHIAEEMWQDLGHSSTVHKDTWPKWNDKYLATDTMIIAVQINGKVRAEIEVDSDAGKDEILSLAKADSRIKNWIDGKEIKKEVYVAGRLVSLVV